jgi:hypothetical protein
MFRQQARRDKFQALRLPLHVPGQEAHESATLQDAALFVEPAIERRLDQPSEEFWGTARLALEAIDFPM